ncbi:MAG: hypothetical protein RL336_890 [Pseudomonadota bacterium]|jgi:hypothetical protein
MSYEHETKPDNSPAVINDENSEQIPRAELTEDDLTCIRLMLL